MKHDAGVPRAEAQAGLGKTPSLVRPRVCVVGRNGDDGDAVEGAGDRAVANVYHGHVAPAVLEARRAGDGGRGVGPAAHSKETCAMVCVVEIDAVVETGG